MKKLFLILILFFLLLAPAWTKAAVDCQQGCFAASTNYVNHCAEEGGLNCTTEAHDLIYCPCMRGCQPDTPIQGCQDQ